MSSRKPGRFQGDRWYQEKVEELMRKALRELQAQGQMRNTTIVGLRGSAWYKEEFKKHAKQFDEERKKQAAERTAHLKTASLNALDENAALIERDKAWAAEHERDSDEQLLDYLCRCAAELGHSPLRREVLGSTYIAERFGNWAVALTMASLPLPKGLKKPKETAIQAYLKRRQNINNIE